MFGHPKPSPSSDALKPSKSTTSLGPLKKQSTTMINPVPEEKKSGTSVSSENAIVTAEALSMSTGKKRRIAKNVPPIANPNAMTRVTPVPSQSATKVGNDKTAEQVNMALLQMVGKALTEYTWYHGLMPRIECEEMLKQDGDFVVRRTTMKKISIYCISANTNNTIKHIPLEYKKGQWTVLGDSSTLLNELIEKLVKEKKQIGTTGVVLRTGIPRPDFYLLHENITVDKRLGGGAFGEVFTGTLLMKSGLELKVAVKKIKGQVKKEQVAEFIKEAKLMRRFCHPNTVREYGVAPQEEPMMIVMELAAGGSLKGYFKSNPKCKDEQCISFMKDACRGMCYLSSSQVIHRDLAARNCLLGDRNEVKISDFGLSVADKKELKITKMKSVPVKWLSPETLTEGVFTSKTDVWSFGVLTWEIFSRCVSDPFPKETNAQAKVKILGDAPPMEPPAGSPAITKKVMDQCFIKDSQKRADFVSLLKLVAPDEKPPSKADGV